MSQNVLLYMLQVPTDSGTFSVNHAPPTPARACACTSAHWPAMQYGEAGREKPVASPAASPIFAQISYFPCTDLGTGSSLLMRFHSTCGTGSGGSAALTIGNSLAPLNRGA
jgi:hypothetical protein